MSNKKSLGNPGDTHGYITVDREWMITSCNTTFRTILGLGNKQIVGTSITDIFCKDDRFWRVCEYLNPVVSQCPSGTTEVHTTSYIGDDKIPISMEIITIPGQKGEMAGAYIGFSDLSKPMATSRLALDSIVQGVFTIDQSWKITSWNKPAEKITGYTEKEVLGRNCKAVFRSPLCKPHCAKSRSFNDCVLVTHTTVYIATKSGGSVPVQFSAAPLLDHEKIS